MSISSNDWCSLMLIKLAPFLSDDWRCSVCFVLWCPLSSSLIGFLFKEVKCLSFSLILSTPGLSLPALPGLRFSRFDSSSSSSSSNSKGGCQWNVSLSFWCFLLDRFPLLLLWWEPLLFSVLFLRLCLRLAFFLLLCFSGSGTFSGLPSDGLDKAAAILCARASTAADIFLHVSYSDSELASPSSFSDMAWVLAVTFSESLSEFHPVRADNFLSRTSLDWTTCCCFFDRVLLLLWLTLSLSLSHSDLLLKLSTGTELWCFISWSCELPLSLIFSTEPLMSGLCSKPALFSDPDWASWLLSSEINLSTFLILFREL